MLGAIGLILRVLLTILLIIALLLLLLISVRIGVEIVAVNGDVTITLRYGFIRIPIYALKKEKTKQKKPVKKQGPADKPKTKSKYVLVKENIVISEIVSLAKTLLKEHAKTMQISRLRIRLILATEDAAKTAILYGKAFAAAGMIIPILENTFEMKDYHIRIDADFEKQKTEWACSANISFRPIAALFILGRHRKELYQLWKKLIKKEEANYHE